MMINRLTTSLVAAIAVMVAAAPAMAENQVTVADVFAFGDPDPVRVDGASTLVRTLNGVGVTVNASELDPNAVYTLWWVAFNNPERCFTPCACGADDLFTNDLVDKGVFWGAGRVADAHGQAAFAATVDYGELPDGPDQVPFGAGFDSPISPGAEIHPILRTHGLPEDVVDQLTMFNGGCPPRTCEDVQFAVHRSPTCRARGRSN